jgi:DNA-binding MarR family transcriptional regulator
MYDAALAASGLRSTQFAVLAEVERQGNSPPTMRELADALVMDRSTLGQNLRPLERDGLISISVAATDRRRRNVVLTKAGRARLNQAKPLWSAAQARFEARFGTQAAADLRHILIGIADDRALSAGNEGNLSASDRASH